MCPFDHELIVDVPPFPHPRPTDVELARDIIRQNGEGAGGILPHGKDNGYSVVISHGNVLFDTPYNHELNGVPLGANQILLVEWR